MTWCQNLTQQMQSGGELLTNDTMEAAKSLLELHQQRKVDIDGRYSDYVQPLRDYGELLTAQAQAQHPAAARAQITERLQELDQSWAAINQTWQDRKQLLTTQLYDLQVRAMICRYVL